MRVCPLKSLRKCFLLTTSCLSREAFETFDRDGNGFIDLEELQSVILSVGDHVKR